MRIVILAAALASALSFPASACRWYVPKPAVLVGYHEVMLASVRSSVRLDSRGWNSFRITARGERVLAGRLQSSRYIFNSVLSSSGCGRTPLPAVGERWIVYLQPKRPSQVIEAFPLDYVRRYDRRLTKVR